MVYENRHYEVPPVVTSKTAYLHYNGCFTVLKNIAENKPVVFHKERVRYRYSMEGMFDCFPKQIKDMFVCSSQFFSMFNVKAVMENGVKNYISPDLLEWKELNFLNIAYFEVEDNYDFLNDRDTKDIKVQDIIFRFVDASTVTQENERITHLTCSNCGHYNTLKDFTFIQFTKHMLPYCVPHIKLDHFDVPLCSKCIEMNYVPHDNAYAPYTKRRTTMRKKAIK